MHNTWYMVYTLVPVEPSTQKQNVLIATSLRRLDASDSSAVHFTTLEQQEKSQCYHCEQIRKNFEGSTK